MTGRAADALGVTGVGSRASRARPPIWSCSIRRSVIDRATYVDPRLPPDGIERVWVAGREVARGGALTADVEIADPDPRVAGAPARAGTLAG